VTLASFGHGVQPLALGSVIVPRVRRGELVTVVAHFDNDSRTEESACEWDPSEALENYARWHESLFVVGDLAAVLLVVPFAPANAGASPNSAAQLLFSTPSLVPSSEQRWCRSSAVSPATASDLQLRW
jgi:hypothetical protein